MGVNSEELMDKSNYLNLGCAAVTYLHTGVGGTEKQDTRMGTDV